jgi:hypothetical protein
VELQTLTDRKTEPPLLSLSGSKLTQILDENIEEMEDNLSVFVVCLVK